MIRVSTRRTTWVLVTLAGLAGSAEADSGFLTICDPFGPGFFGVPGTDTCLRLSGDLRSEARYRTSRETIIAEPGRDATGPTIDFRRGNLNENAPLLRTRAELKTFLTSVVMTDHGALTATAGFKTRADTLPGGVRPDPFEDASNRLLLERAYITWGRFSAGYGPSIFDFTPSLSYTTGYASEINTTHIAYSHPLGDDTTLTLSLEDGGQREIVDASWGEYAGRQAPDMVASLRRRFDWGAAQAAAAIHPIWGVAATECCAPIAADALGSAAMLGLEAYFEIGGTSGELLVNAGVSRGGLSYLGIFDYPADFAISADGEIFLTDAQAIVAAYAHWWTPTLRGVATVSHFWTALETDTFQWRTAGLLAQAALELHPRRGFIAGLELNYHRDRATGGPYGAKLAPAIAEHLQVVGFARFRY